MWMAWIGLILLALVFLLMVWVVLQYRRFRRLVPKVPFRQTRSASVPQKWTNDDVTVTWVGHSTLYINLFGVRILTDPVFSRRVGVSLAGIKVGPMRHTSPALRLEDVAGQVDVILLSHAHMDHFDIPSLRRLADKHVQVITAAGTGRLLRRMQFGRVTELGNDDTVTLPGGITITAIPVRHWGARYPWNKNYAWSGYIVRKGPVCLLFAGDTAYTPMFKQLREQIGIDIACMPIGAYAPDSFQRAHCTPEQAWQMFVESGAKWMIPMHWDTFVLSEEPVHEPMQRLLNAAGDEVDKIVVREHGDVFALSHAIHALGSPSSHQ